MSRAEMLIAVGFANGYAKSTSRALLFGPVPESVVAQVQDASNHELDAWLDRVFAAETLDAVFAI